MPGNFLISIILGTVTSYFLGIINFSSIDFSLLSFEDYKSVMFSFNFDKIATIPFWTATFSVALVLVFENIGLLHSQVNGMLQAPEKNSNSLRAVSISTIVCGFLGTSPTVSTVETAAGITAGGRTGLTSVVTGFFILSSLLFMPFIKLVPNAAIAPILILLGGLMLTNIVNIDFTDFTEAFPAFLIIIMIPLTYSIVDGIAFGFIAYPLVKLFTNKQKQLSPSIFIISILFLTNFLLHTVG